MAAAKGQARVLHGTWVAIVARYARFRESKAFTRGVFGAEIAKTLRGAWIAIIAERSLGKWVILTGRDGRERVGLTGIARTDIVVITSADEHTLTTGEVAVFLGAGDTIVTDIKERAVTRQGDADIIGAIETVVTVER